MRSPGKDTVLVIAHRGSSGTAPENTMAAFREAAASGAGMIELDVRLTQDREPVVLHDRTLRRTTGARGRVWEVNLSEIRRLDAGRWFGPRHGGEPIPTLREVLAWLPDTLGLNIEIKTDGDPRPARVAAQACVSALQECGVPEKLLVSSFNGRVLGHVRRLMPGLATGVLYVPKRGRARGALFIAPASQDGVFICSRAQLRRRMARKVHLRGLQLFCYTINDRRQLRSVLACGVDGVITDYPARVCRLLAT